MPVPKSIKGEFLQDCAELTTAELEDKYGKAPSTVKEWRLDLFRSGDLLWWPGIRVHEENKYQNQVILHGDCIVIGDVEVPYHDPVILGYAVAIAGKFGIKNLVIAGDFLAVDEYSYFATEDGGTETKLVDTIWSGGDVLKSLFMTFDRIIMIKGNHEQRGSKQKELGFFRLLESSWEWLGNLDVSFYKWCEVYSGGKKFRVEHPGNYSKVPGSVVRERAEIEGCTVLGGHTHHFSLSFTKDGKNQAVDIGCCTDSRMRYYKTVNGTTRHPKWTSGFWMVRKGYLYGFPKDNTDWAFWLKGE